MATATYHNILQNLDKLNEDELAQLANRATVLRVARSGVGLSEQEGDLIKRINQTLSRIDSERLDQLVALRRDENLSKKQLSELIKLTEQVEHLQADRLMALSKLAALRGQPVDELFSEFGFN